VGDARLGKLSVNRQALKNVFDMPEFEKRARVVTRETRRQSNRSMPRVPFKHGVSDQTRLSGQEYPGLCIVTLVFMKGMLMDFPEVELAFAQLIFMALSLEVTITMEEYSDSYLERLQKLIVKFLLIYHAIVGPICECFSKSGLRIFKFHCFLHVIFYICQFGCAFNFFGGFCESHLKSLVKQQSKNTSRCQDCLDLDIMNRQYEVMSYNKKESSRNAYFHHFLCSAT